MLISQSDMYSIGVLAFELFQPFGTEMERVRTLEGLREGTIPDSFCHRWPVLTKYIIKLTSPEPSVRPTASELLQSELFYRKDIVCSYEHFFMLMCPLRVLSCICCKVPNNNPQSVLINLFFLR